MGKNCVHVGYTKYPIVSFALYSLHDVGGHAVLQWKWSEKSSNNLPCPS